MKSTSKASRSSDTAVSLNWRVIIKEFTVYENGLVSIKKVHVIELIVLVILIIVGIISAYAVLIEVNMFLTPFVLLISFFLVFLLPVKQFLEYELVIDTKNKRFGYKNPFSNKLHYSKLGKIISFSVKKQKLASKYTTTYLFCVTVNCMKGKKSILCQSTRELAEKTISSLREILLNKKKANKI